MDHLPTPKSTHSVHPPLTIPRLSLEKYDDGPFDKYPHRMKKYGEFWLKPMSKWMPFLQTWLFFGLIGTVFKCDTNQVWRDFSRELTEVVVTTAPLTHYTRELLPGFDPEHREKVYRCLSIAYKCLNSICNRPIESNVHSKVLLSLSTLGEYLTVLMVWCFPEDRGKVSAKLTRAWPAGILSGGHFLSQRMQNDGWCRRDITKHAQLLTTSGLYYASHFGNPDADVDALHRGCSFTECCSENISEDSYETKHVCANREDCIYVEANPSQLVSILKKGLIPLIPVMEEHTPKLHNQYLNLVESAPNRSYVAISHVWSEGLGNLSQNSLPRCQLLRLSRFVKELYDSKTTDQLYFWIDSICCPREPMEFRGVAIGKMRDTYYEADKVLVLDSWLQTQTTEYQSSYELGFKVFMSKWNKRLWTLQEGALAKVLFFRFKSGSIPYPDGEFGDDFLSLKSCLDLESTDLKQVLLKATYTVVHRALRGYKLSTADEQHDSRLTFGIIRGLKYRATSHENDEALCLGALFNLDLKKIFETQEEARMATFWRLLPNIPPSLIFSFAPRLELDGFRWAPRTVRWLTSAFFDDYVDHVPPRGEHYTSAEGDGLLVHYPGVLFDCQRKPLFHTFYFKSEHWYRVSCNAFFETRKVTLGLEHPSPIAEDHKKMVDWYGNVQSSKWPGVGLVLSTSLSSMDEGFSDGRAILVSIREESNNILFANFESTVSVTKVATYIPDIKFRKKTLKVVKRTKTRGNSQRWCLS